MFLSPGRRDTEPRITAGDNKYAGQTYCSPYMYMHSWLLLFTSNVM